MKLNKAAFVLLATLTAIISAVSCQKKDHLYFYTGDTEFHYPAHIDIGWYAGREFGLGVRLVYDNP